MLTASSFSDPTVLVSIISSLSALVGIVIHAVLSHFTQGRATGERAEQAKAIAEIHVLVNSKMDSALKRIARLEHAQGLQPGEEPPDLGEMLDGK